MEALKEGSASFSDGQAARKGSASESRFYAIAAQMKLQGMWESVSVINDGESVSWQQTYESETNPCYSNLLRRE